jgi:arylsulfatase A-like enzyme/Tfp pilus assembly protein PilF
MNSADRRLAAVGLALILLTSVFAQGCRDERSAAAEVHRQAGASYLAQNQLEQALAEYEKAREIDPEHLPTQLQIAVVYARQQRVEDALATVRNVTKRDTEFAAAYELWGTLLARTGEVPASIAKFERALEIDPRSVNALGNLGDGLVVLGRNGEALAVFKRLTAVEPKLSAPVLGRWATALERLGRKDEARVKYEAALEERPDYAPALNNFGLFLVRSPDEAERERGVRLLEAALRQKPTDADLLHNVGWAYLQVGRATEAYDLMRRAVNATQENDTRYAARIARLQEAKARLPRRPASPHAPNVLLVAIDTLRADHLGAYGYPRATSPKLDALAHEGVVFEQAISQAPWTAASFASLFTGLYPSVHGLDGGVSWAPGQSSAGGTLPFAVQKTLPLKQPTLAELLRRHGYQTAGFVSNVYVNSVFGFSHGFLTYDDEHRDYSRAVGRVKRRGEKTNARVFEWLELGPEEPFFLFVHYNDPHAPYYPPAPFGREWVKDYRGDLTPESTTAVIQRGGEPVNDLSPEDLAYLIGLYDGEIAYTDARVGELLERVRGLDLKRDLLIVVTADHGEEFLEHGSTSHGYTLFEEQVHVPLILHYPSRLKPRRVRAQVRHIDVLPTLLALARIDERPPGVQGQSLVALAEGRTEQGPGIAISEATYVGDRKALRRSDGLKLIRSFAGEPDRLFDLKQDPREQSDLLAAGEAPPEPLVNELTGWLRESQETRTALFGEDGVAQEVILDSETQDRLEALGYIE